MSKKLTIVNLRGVLTRKEVGMMTGWGQPYIYLLIQNGRLVSTAPTYYGTIQVFTKKDVDRCKAKIKPHYWDNRKGAVTKKRKKAKTPKLA